MKTKIAKVTFTVVGGVIRFQIAEGVVVAHGCTTERPCCVQEHALSKDIYAWDRAFRKFGGAAAFAARGGTYTRRLRLTTLGYDRTDRVVT